MEKKQIGLLVLLILLLIFLFMAFVSKATNWDDVENKTYVRDNFPETFPGEEGLIVVDVFLFVAYSVAIFLTFRPHQKATTFLIIFLLIMLFIRFILSMLFLAGDDNYVHRMINFCNDQPYDPIWSYGSCNSPAFKSLKAAWGIEVLAVILVNLFSAATIFLLFKTSGASLSTQGLLDNAE